MRIADEGVTDSGIESMFFLLLLPSSPETQFGWQKSSKKIELFYKQFIKQLYLHPPNGGAMIYFALQFSLVYFASDIALLTWQCCLHTAHKTWKCCLISKENIFHLGIFVMFFFTGKILRFFLWNCQFLCSPISTRQGPGQVPGQGQG